jgi:hypothetical protein
VAVRVVLTVRVSPPGVFNVMLAATGASMPQRGSGPYWIVAKLPSAPVVCSLPSVPISVTVFAPLGAVTVRRTASPVDNCST